jgi:hypothetical protein
MEGYQQQLMQMKQMMEMAMQQSQPVDPSMLQMPVDPLQEYLDRYESFKGCIVLWPTRLW